MKATPSDDGPLRAGTVLGGRYRLEKEIGSGAMGFVWRAKHVGIERPVAVKFVTMLGANAKSRRDRFEREAKIVASLRHRNIVDILDFGELGGRAYMVLELLEGESLEERLAKKKKLPVDEAVNVAMLTLSALAAVHAAGIVHRDVKPANIVLVKDHSGEFPKLLDFGVSKTLDGDEDGRGVAVTQDGGLVGTPQYMSPEQMRGLRDVDARTDVWAMGVVLYEMLTGKKPFDGKSFGDVMLAVTELDPPRANVVRKEVSAYLGSVVARAMERDRDKRFKSAAEMRSALVDHDAPGRTSAAAPVMKRRKGEGVVRKSRWKWITALVVVLLAGAGAGAYALFPDEMSALAARVLHGSDDAAATPTTATPARPTRPRPARRPIKRRAPR